MIFAVCVSGAVLALADVSHNSTLSLLWAASSETSAFTGGGDALLKGFMSASGLVAVSVAS